MKEQIDNKKEEYWQHWINQELPKGFTKKKLDKVKKIIWTNKFFWTDILLRHGGMDKTPDQLKEDGCLYEHCMSNMTGMVRETIQKEAL